MQQRLHAQMQQALPDTSGGAFCMSREQPYSNYAVGLSFTHRKKESMSDTITETPPAFVVEVRRYDDPDIFRFFAYGEVHEPQPMTFPLFDHLVAEVDRHQLKAEHAETKRAELTQADYRPISYSVIPAEMHRLIKFCCPIEFHKGLASNDPAITDRIKLWIRELKVVSNEVPATA